MRRARAVVSPVAALGIRARGLAALAGALALWCAVSPGVAGAHAVLTGTTPERGAVLDAAPREVAFAFSEPVEASFGAVEVYDAEGRRVDAGEVTRPGGAPDALATRLRGDLPDGTYTATYRVVSADGHPVSGGFVFTAGDAGGAPARSVAELLAGREAGPVTDVAFGVARTVGYAAIAVAVGGLAFLLLVWREDGRAFAARVRRLLVAAAAAGSLATAAGLALQGAVAAGTTFWAALGPAVLADVAATRYGTATLARLAAWAALAALLTLPFPPRRAGAVALGACAAVLVVTPALGGHAGATSPSWLLVPADAVHVAAMSAWLGGLALLLVAVPVATRALPAGERSAPLARTVERFSALALVCVAALVATGVLASIVHLDAVAELWETAWGRAVAAKAALLAGLVAIAAYNRQRVRPRLRALGDARRPPGPAGRALRTAIRAEVVLAIAVLGVTAALVSYAPSPAASGLLAERVALGPAQADVTIAPLRRGPQELHLYVVDARTGAPWTRIREVTATLREDGRGIGPLPVRLQRAGPGHYVATDAAIGVAGTWTLALELRVSRFDAFAGELDVEVR